VLVVLVLLLVVLVLVLLLCGFSCIALAAAPRWVPSTSLRA